MGDRDNLSSETEREQQFSRMWHEADDPHPGNCMETLSDKQIIERLDGALSAWTRQGETIVRDHEAPDFAAAIVLVGQVAELAEEANHHPDILVHGWNQLRLTLSTHSAGGLTEADFALAGRLDALLR